jgi:hypothetical protein
LSVGITPPVGSLSLVGQVPVVRVSYSITPPSGALGLAGGAPGLAVPLAITPLAGVLAALGQAPLVLVPQRVTPTSGALGFVSNAPPLTLNTLITPPSGAASFVASAPSLGVAIFPPAGVLGLAGQYAETITPGVARAHSGALALLGCAPQLSVAPPYVSDPNYVVMPPCAPYWFRSKHPNESAMLTFNLANLLIAGERLIGIPIITVSTVYGGDQNPMALLNGGPQFDATGTGLLVPVAGGVDQNDYAFQIECMTTNAEKILARPGLLPVRLFPSTEIS